MGKRFNLFILLTFIGFTAAFAALLMIPLTDLGSDGVQQGLSVAVGLLFWIGNITGIVGAVVSDRLGKKIVGRIPKLESHVTQRFPGVLNFRIDTFGLVLYFVIAAGIILMVFDLIFEIFAPQVMFPVIAATYYSFVIHCVADGRNFKIYKLLKKGKKNGD